MKMRVFHRTLAAWLAALITVAAPAAADNFPTQVRTEGGSLQGGLDEGVLAFKGIPYVQAPLVDLRWRAPQPVKPWPGTRDATQLSPDCMQGTLGPPPPGGRHVTAEDCLYLNIWRPVEAAKQKLPVMVWIHGGGFVNGGSSSVDSTG